MKKVIIVEDSKEYADTLRQYLEQFSIKNGEDFIISHYMDALSFLASYNGDTDIIFMDIELPDVNGMEAVRRIRKIDKNVVVIFVTNMAQYAVHGYEVEAYDFIVKPVSYYNFSMKLERAIKHIGNNKDSEIWINIKSGRRRIRVSQIRYVDIFNHEVTYHTEDGNYSFVGTIKKVQEQLAEFSFALCNQCYLVNLRYVTEIQNDYVVVGNEKLRISQPKKKDFIRLLNNYLNGGE